MALPHIKNSQAGVNLYDPVYKSIFEVYFTLPDAIRGEFAKDEVLLSQHVTKISGLELFIKLLRLTYRSLWVQVAHILNLL